ncbi:hypothetical protein OF001_U40106 [Pseudomonas sp. OF001]|nr:hypothetical protein OF001_U40106 [Pseudomonas sp. OF001]
MLPPPAGRGLAGRGRAGRRAAGRQPDRPLARQAHRHRPRLRGRGAERGRAELPLPPAGRRLHPAQRRGLPEDAQLGLRRPRRAQRRSAGALLRQRQLHPAAGHPGAPRAGHRDQQDLGQRRAGQHRRQRHRQHRAGAPVRRGADPGAQRGAPVPPPGRHRPQGLPVRQRVRRPATRRHGPGHLRADPALRQHPVHLLQPRDPGRQPRPAARHPPHRALRAVRPVPLDPPHGERRAAAAALRRPGNARRKPQQAARAPHGDGVGRCASLIRTTTSGIPPWPQPLRHWKSATCTNATATSRCSRASR